MDSYELYRSKIEGVARSVQTAYLDIRRDTQSNTLSKGQASLPRDAQTGLAINRLKKFPNDCCMDASIVLAIILIAIADTNNIEYRQFQRIRCRPTEKTKTVMFDFHQWLLVDGFNIDLTFSQLRTVQKGSEDKIVFEQHPIIGSDDYTYEAEPAKMEAPFVEFANFVIEHYLRRQNN